jgi:hypothetical protein
VNKPRSTISFLENQIASLEIELGNLKSSHGHSDSLGEAFATVAELSSGIASNSARPWVSWQNLRRDGKDRTTFSPLKSTTYLSQSPIPDSGVYVEFRVTERLDLDQNENTPRSTNIASIPRNVVDIMLKNYCDIYLPQYPALEVTELYESCSNIYLGEQPSHFDYFIVAITLAISVRIIVPSIIMILIRLGKHPRTA